MGFPLHHLELFSQQESSISTLVLLLRSSASAGIAWSSLYLNIAAIWRYANSVQISCQHPSVGARVSRDSFPPKIFSTGGACCFSHWRKPWTHFHTGSYSFTNAFQFVRWFSSSILLAEFTPEANTKSREETFFFFLHAVQLYRSLPLWTFTNFQMILSPVVCLMNSILSSRRTGLDYSEWTQTIPVHRWLLGPQMSSDDLLRWR